MNSVRLLLCFLLVCFLCAIPGTAFSQGDDTANADSSQLGFQSLDVENANAINWLRNAGLTTEQGTMLVSHASSADANGGSGATQLADKEYWDCHCQIGQRCTGFGAYGQGTLIALLTFWNSDNDLGPMSRTCRGSQCLFWVSGQRDGLAPRWYVFWGSTPWVHKYFTMCVGRPR